MNLQSSRSGSQHRPGLLQAVLCNPSLRQQLGRIPADEKTIALTTDEESDFSHPNWKVGEMDSAAFETIELGDESADQADARPADSGFVPSRQIGKLGDSVAATDYRIVGKLGSGGTAVVYQAHQRAVDREVALKMLRSELAGNRLSRQRFLTEARVIGGLDHPNVIALHEVCIDDAGMLFYSMKRIDGTSWDKQIDEMSESQNVTTLLRVADAIRYAHSRGLVHRDIKPENVMLGKFGEVLLADWGLAISQGERPSQSSEQHHSIGGTPAYMAPELASGAHGEIGFWSDVYLLGATLYQIVTGFPPHHGKTLLECIHAAAHNEIRRFVGGGELFEIAMKAMATRPTDRYHSVEEFVAAIEAQRQHEQSERLVRRAVKRLSEAESSVSYEDFRVADALLAEAIDVWPENTHALQTRRQVQRQFAVTATQAGDLDLAMLIYEAAGEVDSVAAREVRQQRIRRDATHNQVKRYSALFTQSPEAGLLVQMSTSKIVEANQMFGKLFGYTEDQVVGKPIGELNLWASPQRRQALVDELNQTGSIDNFEAQFLHTDGHVIEVLISGRVVEVQGERMLVSTLRDISLRKQAELELRRSQKRLCELQHLAGLASWSYDLSAARLRWSEEAYRLLMPAAIADDASDGFELLHPDDHALLRQAITQTIRSGTVFEVRVRQRSGSDSFQNVLLRGQPICDDQHTIVEVYGVVIPRRR